METIKVLVFPCGSEVGLEIHEALKDVRYVELHGASSVTDHGSFVFSNYHEGVPFLDDRNFGRAFAELLEKLKIDVVFPALDSAALALSEMAESLPCKVVSSSSETAKICRNKKLTYKEFAECWFNPITYAGSDEVNAYPVALKPSVGQGSQGFKVVRSKGELDYELSTRNNEQVICEYLPGEEYTIDCFTDRNGVLRYSSQRVRNRTKSGISVNSYLTDPDAKVREIAECINERLDMRGVWFFQLKRNSLGEYRLLEIAPRVAGTMCLERAIGVNLPLLSVLDSLDYDVEISPQFSFCEVDRALANVFKVPCDYDHVYLDYDDTLVCDGKVRLKVIAFLYQCANKGIPVTLLTRHSGDISLSLDNAKISKSLFCSIEVLGKGERKSDYIADGSSSVFIDDSFAERIDVSRNAGAVALGVESLSVLIDERA